MAFESTPARILIRERLVEMLTAVPIGGVVSHAEIAEVIGPKTTSPDAIKHAAFRDCTNAHGAAFESVRGVGYRRLAPADAPRIGRHARHRVRGIAGRGQRKLIAVISANSNAMPNKEKLQAHTEISLLGMIQRAASAASAARAYRAAEAADTKKQKPPNQAEIAAAVMAAISR